MTLKEYQEKKNKALARFLASPEDEQAASDLDERTIKMEFAEALLEFGDKELLLNPLGRGDSSAQFSPFVIFVLVIIVAVAVHAVLALGTSGVSRPQLPKTCLSPLRS